MVRLNAVLLGLIVMGTPQASLSQAPATSPDECTVTRPNRIAAGAVAPGWYGSADVSVGLWEGGTVVFRPGGQDEWELKASRL